MTHARIAVYRQRLRAFALAEEIGSVRAACRLRGIHHSTLSTAGSSRPSATALELLRPHERRQPRMLNAPSPLIEQRVAFALGHPGFGPKRIAAALARPKWGGI